MLPSQLTALITQFTKLPGIGPRQAARFVFYLLRNESEIPALSDTLKSVQENIKLCSSCFLPASRESLCRICTNPKRDKNTLCIIEKETDALNFEKTGHFQGRYFVLGGFIDPLLKESIAHERLNIFVQKLHASTHATKHRSHDRGNDVQKNLEIILALTPRREGDFTSLYIEKQLKSLKAQGVQIKTTRLGRGLSSGAELEYADEETLKNALEGRK